MDENTDPKTQQNPAEKLQAIMSGQFNLKDISKFVIKSKKLSNDFMRQLVEKLRESKHDNENILEFLLEMDKSIEEGDLDEESFLKLKDPGEVQKIKDYLKDNG